MSIRRSAFDVSVVVPTYNRARVLPRTVSSILEQTHPAREIIIVDDGSTDDTAAALERFKGQIRVTRIDNSGVCRARNIGVAMASGEWVAFCDSDDVWSRDHLAEHARLYNDLPELLFSYANFRILRFEKPCGDKFATLPDEYWRRHDARLIDGAFVAKTPIYGDLLYNQPIFPSTLAIRRSFFEKVGRFNEVFSRTVSEDFEFILRCAQYAPTAAIRRPTVDIHKHGDNFSGNTVRMQLGDVAVLEFARDNHRAAQRYLKEIDAQLLARRALAAHGAFSQGAWRTVLDASSPIPWRRRSWKLNLKRAVARLHDISAPLRTISELEPPI